MTRKPFSNKHRFDILKRDSFTCQYCGASPPDVRLHVDHVIPVALGGTNHDANLVTACQACNSGKRDGLIRPVVIQEWLFNPIGFDLSRTGDLCLVVSIEDMESRVSVIKTGLREFVANGKGCLVSEMLNRTGHNILEPGRDGVIKVPITQWIASNRIEGMFLDKHGRAQNPGSVIEYVLCHCTEFSLSKKNTNTTALDPALLGQGLLDFLSSGPDYALTYAEAMKV